MFDLLFRQTKAFFNNEKTDVYLIIIFVVFIEKINNASYLKEYKI